MALELYLDLLSQPCRSVYIFAKKNNIPFEFKKVTLMHGEQYKDEFQKISLIKKVPALRDGDFCLTESVAILLYLADKFKTPDFWYPADLQQRARIIEYLSWQHTAIRLHGSKMFWLRVLIPKGLGLEVPQDKMDAALEDLNNSLKLIEEKPKLNAWRDRVRATIGTELFDEVHQTVLGAKDNMKLMDAKTMAIFKPKAKFPNLVQTCYLNSTLQGLLTITDFIQGIYNQESVWSSLPKSELLRGFVKVGLARFTTSEAVKEPALTAFKRTVAEFNSEFEDDRLSTFQKLLFLYVSVQDAHEFLSCVLDQLWCVSSDLQVEACNKGYSYTCPVDANITFQMLSTGTCNGCGLQSTREEDYIDLSLDLVFAGENQLEYWWCVECGAEASS
ncbi:hypothetical protein FQN60_011559 [Etheostoma spectabile]|uniref:GST N-terminal domain-containing protein n=1 Tax=Etheostoma spectabile TaxID=54343 RepID=A0A5J5DM17_9PERO|nr:hypothetical protein FQN60_011559 [Etheostoma spectabile]